MTTKVSLIADNAVTGIGISNLTITADDIADSTIPTSKINFGTALVPLGGIIMWSGTTAPSGYQLCNGSDLPSTSPLRPGITNTPDLKDRFIVGAGSQTYPIGATGGSSTVTLTVNEMPSHNHSASTGRSGQHTHTYELSNDTGSFNADGGKGGFVTDTGSSTQDGILATANDNKGDQIGVSSRGDSDENGRHTHSVSIENAGGGQAHENRPPYYALAFIMRVL